MERLPVAKICGEEVKGGTAFEGLRAAVRPGVSDAAIPPLGATADIEGTGRVGLLIGVFEVSVGEEPAGTGVGVTLSAQPASKKSPSIRDINLAGRRWLLGARDFNLEFNTNFNLFYFSNIKILGISSTKLEN